MQIIKNFNPKKDIIVVNPETACGTEVEFLGLQIEKMFKLKKHEAPIVLMRGTVAHLKSTTVKDFIKEFKKHK